MKKSLLLLLLAATVFIGCSKSSSTTIKTNSAIVGKWTETNDSVSVIANGKLQGTSNQPTPDGSYLQLNADGTGISYQPAVDTSAAVSIHITYTLSGSSLTLNYPTFSFGGKIFDASSDKWTVLILTDHKLGLKYIAPDENPNGPNGAWVQFFYYSK